MESHEGKKGPFIRRALVVAALAASALALESHYDSGETKDNHDPLMEVYCRDVDGLISQEVNNWNYGGVEKPWDNEEKLAVFTYNLQAGENLESVAKCYFMDSDDGIKSIATANDITDSNIVQPGQLTIKITNPVQVKLTKEIGSVGEIAYQTGFTAEQIHAANGKSLNDDWDPGEGDVIQLPIQKSSNDKEPKTTSTSTSTSTPTTTTSEVPIPPGDTETRVEEIDAFREKWDGYAVKVAKEFGIDKNAVLAQAILESSFGSSKLTLNGSNLFGVKAHRGAKKTPYWEGETIPKETTEFLSDEQLQEPYWQKRFVEMVNRSETGLNEVRIIGDFRVYGDFEESFMDYGYKIMNESTYADAAKSIDNPTTYIGAVAKAGYATDPDYEVKVLDIYGVLEELDSRGDPKPPEPEPRKKPGPGDVIIDSAELDFSNFPEQVRDEKLKIRIEDAITNISLKKFETFRSSGVMNKSAFAESVMNEQGEYRQLLGRDRSGKLKYVVWHLWANGIPDDGLDAVSGTETSTSQGNSHDIPLESQVRSWHNGFLDDRVSSAQYLVGDNGEVWRLSEKQFSKALHAGSGIQDEGAKYFRDVDNENSIGLEVQADTIYDVTELEFENLIYLTVESLSDAKVITSAMTEDEIRSAVDEAVVGHGKNDSKFNNSGVEFGWKYRVPLVQAVQELAVEYLKD